MPSLRQLLSAHAPLLIIDAASAEVQVGWIPGGTTARWAVSNAESGVGIFQCVEELQVDPLLAGALVFCDGPGSVLGIRTAAMALRTWSTLQPRPMYAYHSLALVAASIGRPGLQIIADARRDSWHCLAADGTLARVPTAALGNDLVMPEGFRNWSDLPANVGRVPYDVGDLLAKNPDADVFRETDAPDAFLHEEPTYVTWTPQVHRAR